MRICVIFNPAARGQKAEKLKGLLGTLMCDCDCMPTSRAGEAQSLAAEAVRAGFDTVVAAGGDGTLNEVLNGIGDVPGGFGKARLGVLPLGTINVFARELGIPLQPERAWEIIRRGREITVDLPVAEFTERGKSVARFFAQLAGAGLDSKAVELLDWELKKKIGPLAYVSAGMKALRTAQPQITASTPGGSMTGELILIGNGRFYGGSFVLFPTASLQDGFLEICAFPKVNWGTLCRASVGLMTKNVHRLCGIKETRAETVTLSANQKTLFQLDGEIAGELPVKLSLNPKMLRVIAP